VTQKVFGHAAAGAKLGRALDFYAVTTAVALNTAPAGKFETPLDKLIEVIALRGQPVIMSVTAGATAGQTVVKFAIEHTDAWALANPNLKDSIVAHAAAWGFTAANTTVAKVDF
jgi:hypothetical protein